MSQPPLVIERSVKAPVAKVWNALTDETEMRKWYFDVSGFKPEVGFEFEFTGNREGTIFHHLCKVTEVVPGHKVAHTWRYKGYPGESLVTIELFEEGGMTRVKLTHQGLETFPQEEDFARANFVGGWTMIIGKMLTDFVE